MSLSKKGRLASKKQAQMWFADFAIGSFIFIFMIILFYIYSTNILKPDVVSIDSVIGDAQTISSALVLAGTPSDWDNQTVESIGISNNNQEINRTKLLRFNELPYNQTIKRFGTIYDYFVYFENENGTAVNVEGLCGVGHTDFNATYNTSIAYYFNTAATGFLKDYMTGQFAADPYSADIGYSDIGSLAGNLGNYEVVVLEHAVLSSAVLTAHRAAFENFVTNGGTLIITGELVTSNGDELTGAEFYKKATQADDDRNSTAVNKHPSFDLNPGDSILFDAAHYIQNTTGATNIQRIQEFTKDNETAMGTWNFGEGSVLYISDVSGNHSRTDYFTIVQRAIPAWGAFQCNKVDVTTISYQNFVRIDRLMIHNIKPVKMVVYVWN